MGGLMSGFQGRRKITVEEVLHLKVSSLKIKRGANYKAEVSWGDKNKTSIGVIKANDNEITLTYTITKNEEKTKVKYDIEIEFTPCNYGGERAWFLCPECEDRVSKLYLKNGYFKCRRCHELNYILQQEDKRDFAVRSIEHKMYKIQDKLKTRRATNNCYAIPKPKGMHYKTYKELIEQLRELYCLRDEVWCNVLEKRYSTLLDPLKYEKRWIRH